MDYSIVEKINFNKASARKVGSFWYDNDTDGLYHESPWPFPVQLLIKKGLSEVYVTPMMLKLPFILKGWINLDILLREIELLKLALNNKILMHASCIVEPGEKHGTLIVGFPNSGKTYRTYYGVSKGATLISEEYTIINQFGTACPYKPVMRTCFSAKTFRHCGMKMTLREKIWMGFATLRAALFPFMYEAVIWRSIPVSGKTAKIKRIVYGSTGQEITNWKTFAILCENEFPFMANEFLQAYAVASGLDLIDIQNKQRNLIKEFVNAIGTCPEQK